MALAPGTRLGPYEILSPLGAGGMGEVYRARDTRLDRTVALKVLPPHLSASPEARERFEREARAVSSLNHPHICTLHDIGTQDGVDFLVLELIEGETLAARLGRGPLPVAELLGLGIQIAGALDRAHSHGIVHRDLKPGNVMLTKTGAKLLDFGLAKAGGPAGGAEALSAVATERRSLTAEGSIVGTFQYMAPEQLEGREADARTDIFAFGALLYEMATGRKAFSGKSQASLITAIMSAEPQTIASQQPMTPPALDRIVRRALAKDPDDRWQSIRDLKSELAWILEAGSQAGAPAPVTARRERRARAGWIAAGVMGLAAAVLLPLALLGTRRPAGMPGVIRFEVTAAPGRRLGESLALSPDGKQLAFVALFEGKPALWIRSLDATEPRQLVGTSGAELPFWSPDGRSIGFFAEGKLKRIDLDGGGVQALCDAPSGRGGSWSRDGMILFSPNFTGPLSLVKATGGAATAVTRLPEGSKETSHRWPRFLPDGRHFLYMARASARGETKSFVGSLDSQDRAELLSGASSMAYAPEGFVLYTQQGNLFGRSFDPGSFRLTGDPILLANGVQTFGEVGPTGYGAFSVSDTGMLAYRAGTTTLSQLCWFDRRGARLDAVGPPGLYDEPALSPDGRRVVIGRADPESAAGDLWIIDLARGTSSRFSFDPAEDITGIWSPDGSRIAFSSSRAGFFDLFVKPASGAGEEESLLKSSSNKWPDDWSSDGHILLYEEAGAETNSDIWSLAIDGDRKPAPVLRTRFAEVHAALSPDRKWIAYTSDESGRPEIYVQSFPPSGGKWQISIEGGGQAAWRRDGRELYFVTPDQDLMAVEVREGAGFEPGVPRKLFKLTALNVGLTTSRTSYAAAADGQRFLVNSLLEDNRPAPITVVVDWTAVLKK